jgi:hypothetical protein
MPQTKETSVYGLSSALLDNYVIKLYVYFGFWTDFWEAVCREWLPLFTRRFNSGILVKRIMRPRAITPQLINMAVCTLMSMPIMVTLKKFDNVAPVSRACRIITFFRIIHSVRPCT